MGEIVREADMGVRRYRMRVTVLIKIATGKEEGSHYLDLPILGIRVGRKEAWEERTEHAADRAESSKVMNGPVSRPSQQQFGHMERKTGV